jgi:hypothetical protein
LASASAVETLVENMAERLCGEQALQSVVSH